MPWKTTEPMTEKERFAVLARTGRFTIRDLCKDFGISRKTGHKYLHRYENEGRIGLNERSRRPKSCPSATVESVERLILGERRKHPTWGPKKIRDLLFKVHGIERPPHESTIGLILSRHGLTQKRKRRPGVHRVRPEHLTEATRPNEVWTFDFKGWFLLQNAQRCDPLTVCDRFSRYVIGCRACPNQQFKGTLRAVKHLMRYHGLPEVIRVDNGTPFASVALGGLSQLSVWWIENGIRVEFIAPASPQQNGSHERMHRDLKAGPLAICRRSRRASSVGGRPIITSGLTRLWTCFARPRFTGPVQDGWAKRTRCAIPTALRSSGSANRVTSVAVARTFT